jgi:hypothetical protein
MWAEMSMVGWEAIGKKLADVYVMEKVRTNKPEVFSPWENNWLVAAVGG